MVELISALIIGAAIGLLDFAFMNSMFSMPSKKFLYCIQAILFASAFVFLAMNPVFIAEKIPFFASSALFTTGVGMQLVAAVLMIAKGALSIMLTGRTMSMYFKQKMRYLFILGALVFASPYAVPFISARLGGNV